MSMLAGTVGAVIGLDTHRDHHTVAVVDPTGAALTSTELPTDAFGYRRMLAFARDHAPGRRVWAIEGTGSFGAGLTTYLLEHEDWVVEIDRPARPARRNGAKTDELDAARAAREALAREYLAQPRRRGDREAMRVLLTTRAGTVWAPASVAALACTMVWPRTRLMVALPAPGTACTAAVVTACRVSCALAWSRCNVRASSLIATPRERVGTLLTASTIGGSLSCPGLHAHREHTGEVNPRWRAVCSGWRGRKVCRVMNSVRTCPVRGRDCAAPRWQPSGAYRVVRRLARDAGIPGFARVHPQALRHTAVTRALDSGANLVDVQDMAGHRDPRTTSNNAWQSELHPGRHSAALLHRLFTVGARGAWHGFRMVTGRGSWRVGR